MHAGRIVNSSQSAQKTASHVITTVPEQQLPILDEYSSMDFTSTTAAGFWVTSNTSQCHLAIPTLPHCSRNVQDSCFLSQLFSIGTQPARAYNINSTYDWHTALTQAHSLLRYQTYTNSSRNHISPRLPAF